jgi:hypothetical protein
MSIQQIFSDATWHAGLSGAAIVSFMAGAFLWNKSREMTRTAMIYDCAFDLTDDFYRLADEILSDGAVPDSLHNMIYDMVEFATDENKGQRAYDQMIKVFASNKRPKVGAVHKELIELGKHRIDLYEKIGSSVSTWVFAMAASYGHSDIKVTKTMVDSTDRPKLFDVTEKLLLWIKNGPDEGNGGTAVHA